VKSKTYKKPAVTSYWYTQFVKSNHFMKGNIPNLADGTFISPVV